MSKYLLKSASTQVGCRRSKAAGSSTSGLVNKSAQSQATSPNSSASALATSNFSANKTSDANSLGDDLSLLDDGKTHILLGDDAVVSKTSRVTFEQRRNVEINFDI